MLDEHMGPIKKYSILTVGAGVLALANYVFKFPNHFSFGGVAGFVVILSVKSTHNRRECPVHGHRGGSRGRFYYRSTTFEGRPWDARDPH